MHTEMGSFTGCQVLRRKPGVLGEDLCSVHDEASGTGFEECGLAQSVLEGREVEPRARQVLWASR